MSAGADKATGEASSPPPRSKSKSVQLEDEGKGPHLQLAGLPRVGDRAHELTKGEAERRLVLAIHAAALIQLRTRDWMALMHTTRERYKCTTRGFLEYHSNRPPDHEMEEARQERREQHGWRAPLNRRYLPLGDPNLKLGRKPDWGEWAAKAAAEESLRNKTRLDHEKNVFVGHGETVHGSVAKFGFAYFQTYMYDAKATLVVTVEALAGDPDLFMSRSNPHPDQVNHTWASDDLGADVIEVPSTDPNFGLGQYYIAVYGGGGGLECRFQITVEASRPLGGAASGAQMLEGGKTNHVRAAAELADHRRRRTAAGMNAAALMAAAGGTHSGKTPSQRLEAVKQLPRPQPRGEAQPSGLSDAECGKKLLAVLGTRIEFALAARNGGQASITADWLCQVLAQCTRVVSLPARTTLTHAGEPAAFVAFVVSGELQVAADADMMKASGMRNDDRRARFSPSDVLGEEPLLGQRDANKDDADADQDGRAALRASHNTPQLAARPETHTAAPPETGGDGVRPHTVIALAPSEVVLLSYDALLRLMELEPESCDTLLRLIAVCSTANPHLALAAADAVVAGADRGGKKQAALRQAQSATAAFASGFTDRLRDQTWLDGMGANEALASKNGARSTASSTLNGGGENTPRGRSSGRSPRQSRSTSPGPTPAPSHRAMAELRSAAAALDDDDDAQWHPLRSHQHHPHHQHHQHGAGSERSGSAGADSSQPRLGQDATWSEHTDPASGVAYYHNNATGASSWHRPPHLSASLRQHTSGGSAGLRTAASAPTLGSSCPSASDASAASTASIARPLTAQPATGLGSGGGGLGGGGGARKRPTSAATLFFQRRDHEKVAHSRHALPAASRAGRPHAGTMGSGGRPSKGDDLLIYYELLNDSAVAATDAMFRPGALAVKATAEATSASLCRPQTAPAYNKPGPAAAMSPQRSPDGGSRRGGGASPASDAGGGMQPTSATGGALGGNRRPTAAQRRAATEAMLKQQFERRESRAASMMSGDGGAGRSPQKAAQPMSKQFVARLQWQQTEFEQMKREHARKLHTELHLMAEARLEAYQRKFTALDVRAIADAKYFDPQTHMRKVRLDVERRMCE